MDRRLPSVDNKLDPNERARASGIAALARRALWPFLIALMAASVHQEIQRMNCERPQMLTFILRFRQRSQRCVFGIAGIELVVCSALNT